MQTWKHRIRVRGALAFGLVLSATVSALAPEAMAQEPESPVPAATPSTTAAQGTISLKDGTTLTGKIVELVPQSHVTVDLSSGQSVTVPWGQVAKVERQSEPTATSSATQPATSSAPATPTGPYVAPLYQKTQESYVPQSVAMSGPQEIPNWNEGDPIPPGYHATTRARRGLIIGGAVTFGSLYLLSALVAAAGSDSSYGGNNREAPLWIPGLGPFVRMASNSSATGNVVLLVDGLAQCAGLTMLTVGLMSPKTVLVRNDLGEDRPAPAEHGTQIAVTPIVGPSTTGVGVVGSF